MLKIFLVEPIPKLDFRTWGGGWEGWTHICEKSGAHHDWALKKILSSKFSQIDFELIEKELRLSHQDSFENDAAR